MPSFSLVRQDGPVLETLPIDQAVYEAARQLQAQVRVKPDAEQAPTADMPDVTMRALVDIPVFVDHKDRQVQPKRDDVFVTSAGVAALLVRRQKAVVVEVSA